MKNFSAALLLVAVSAPAFAQSGTSPAQTAAHEATFICWYNPQGKLTSAEPSATNGPIRYLMLTGRGDDHAWAYKIHSTDGHDCPARVPQP